jgi:CBS domain-containing protein
MQSRRPTGPPAPAPHAPPPHTLKGDALAAYGQTQQSDKPAQREQLEHVSDVMTHEVFSVKPDMSVSEAWEALAKAGFAQAPVLDAQGQLVGLLMRADMISTVLLPSPDSTVVAAWQLGRQPVRALMLTPVPAVAPSTLVRRAARVMLDMGLPGLPVTVDDGRVIGFLSRADILRAVVADPPLDLWT